MAKKVKTTPDAQTSAWAQVIERFPEANFLQSPSWGEVNQKIGHKIIHQDFDSQGWCLMIVKQAKRGRYLEIPGGPLIDWQDEALVTQVFAEIRAVARREHCAFVRLRPQLRSSSQNLARLAALGCRKAPMHLHAEHTILLDLTQTEPDLLSAMRRQTRYEVRRSAKLGLQVSWQSDQAIFEEFQQVQAATALRQGFIPPSLATLLAERAAFGEAIRIYVAQTSAGEPVAYGLILWSGEEAEYFEAASTDLNRKLPGAYALQWQVIQDMKQLGLKRYNLWGIAPPGAKNHRYSGVTTFKTGFGGEIIEFVPAQDIIISKSKYLKDWAIETVRRKSRHL